MSDPLADIQQQYSMQLEQASYGYLMAGLGQFSSERKQRSYAGGQSIVGNLAIAVELMLKSFLANRSLLVLFKSVPVEIRVLLTNPDSLPAYLQLASI